MRIIYSCIYFNLGLKLRVVWLDRTFSAAQTLTAPRLEKTLL